MDYSFTPQALKQLEKLSKDVQVRIVKKLDFYCMQKSPLDFAEHLTDKSLGSYRFRIGDFRVVFDIEREKVIVLVVGHRREIYK